MHYVWGSLMAFMGLFLFISGLKKSEFVLYKLMHARANYYGEIMHIHF